MPRDLIRPALDGLVAYEPGKPIEEVQRELGLERVVKLGSNEGHLGPFPQAVEAIERSLPGLNDYPDGGAYHLVQALAAKHGVDPGLVAAAAGADAVITYLTLVTLDPGDEAVYGWPSFAIYPLTTIRMGAVPVPVPLTDYRYDVDAMLDAITDRTKLVYLCNPNNPTGTMITREEVDRYFSAVPDHVLTVLDEAYSEFVGDPDYPDGIEEHVKAGRRVLVLRTFSKIYGLAGMRVGYGIGPKEVVDAIKTVRNSFDISTPAQVAALASLGDHEEVARRRALAAELRADLVERCLGLGLTIAPDPVANFLFAEVGGDSREVFQKMLREGVIVRPLGPFGAPDAIRVTVSSKEDHAAFAEALGRVLALTG
ncbi:MAG TPA: aminotransferase class I/II-fold pyridoxal phosphate-dependent enzyme [Gaiellaceae bacterium]|nr:aminotransferase class I/II-fold pyridoxal phosphate-dependent enzyme [Gaiellaceae bacterium]